MHLTTNLMDIQLALAQKYLSNDVISEYQCMRTQNQMMNNIKQILQKKKHPQNSYDLGNIEASTISHVNMTHFFDDSLSLNKSKFTEDIEQSILAGALKQIKENCSNQAHDAIKQYLQNSKIKQYENIQKKVQKYKTQNEEMTSQIYILKIEKGNLEKQLDKYKKMVENIEDQKKNIKKKTDYILDKENRIYKLQTSFAFKEKINVELKKRYERLRDNALAIQKKVQAIYHALDQIWDNICQKVQSVDCPQKCWKKDVMAKCKNQLVEERKILKEQSAHIQKEYDVMNMVSIQFKKIFQDPDASTNKKDTSNNKSIISQSEK